MRSTGKTGRADAQKVADAFEAAYQGKKSMAQIWRVLSDAAEFTTGTNPNEITLRGYVEKWREGIRNEVDPNSYRAYESRTDSFMKVMLELGFDKKPLVSITKKELIAFRDAYAVDHAANTANEIMSSVRRMFAAAKDDELVADNPCDGVKKVVAQKGKKRPRRPYTLVELRLVLVQCTGPRAEWYSIVMFGLYTGQRLGDIACMTWRDVDLMHDEVRFVTRKTKAVVIVPMAAALKDFILTLTAPDDLDAAVHPNAYANFVKAKYRTPGLSREFRDILVSARLREPDDLKKKKKVGGKRKSHPLSFHSLRHTLVSMLKNAGVSSSVVEDIVGHESEEVNQVYTHIDQASKALAMRKLPALDLMRELF